MKKTIIIVSSIILAIVVIVAIAGMYKFNFTDDDIYLPNDEEPKTEETTWKTFSDTAQKISWQYPETLDASYISLAEWPPKISLTQEVFSCPETITIDNPANTIAKKIVNNKTYCIETSSEGAAGSIYTTYTYSTKQEDNLVAAKFTLRYPQCYNYDDSVKAVCEKEYNNFALNELVDKIVNTIKITK